MDLATTEMTGSLTLRIGAIEYRIRPLARPSGRAWRLRRLDDRGRCVVAAGPIVPTCSCED